MIGWRAAAVRAATVALLAATAAGCTSVVGGTPTWVGARLERAVLGADDVEPGTAYQRLDDDPAQPDGAGGAAPLPTRPPGCSDGLTRDIAATAQRGAGSAVKYTVSYPGVRVVMTVTSWALDLPRLSDTATRCARFEALFDPSTPGIPITTAALPATRDEQLVYQQTLSLGGTAESLWMVFFNAGGFGGFGVATPTGPADGSPTAPLPATLLELADRQADRMAQR